MIKGLLINDVNIKYHNQKLDFANITLEFYNQYINLC